MHACRCCGGSQWAYGLRCAAKRWLTRPNHAGGLQAATQGGKDTRPVQGQRLLESLLQAAPRGVVLSGDGAVHTHQRAQGRVIVGRLPSVPQCATHRQTFSLRQIAQHTPGLLHLTPLHLDTGAKVGCKRLVEATAPGDHAQQSALGAKPAPGKLLQHLT